MYRHGEFERACSLLEDQLHMHGSFRILVEQAKSLVRLTMAQLAAGTLEDALNPGRGPKRWFARLGPDTSSTSMQERPARRSSIRLSRWSSNFAWYVEGNWKA